MVVGIHHFKKPPVCLEFGNTEEVSVTWWWPTALRARATTCRCLRGDTDLTLPALLELGAGAGAGGDLILLKHWAQIGSQAS
jgi:hypothetical protein